MSEPSASDTRPAGLPGPESRTEGQGPDASDQFPENGALQVRVRSKRFHLDRGAPLEVLGGIEFTLLKRSFTCIVGPSGCGKTTMLRIVLGLEAEFDGSVRHCAGGPVAAVFQEPRLLPWRTVEDNVRLALPQARQATSLDELFGTLGLRDHRRFYPGELSLGLARRAALARAFALEPSLLVLDEPFVSLDNATAARLRDLLMTVWQSRPTTALMVTHDIEEAVALADRILVFGDKPARVVGEVVLRTARDLRDAAWSVDAVAEVRRQGAGVE